MLSELLTCCISFVHICSILYQFDIIFYFQQSQLQGRPPSLDEQIDDSDENDDKLMMTEYDEDNVIVIDLSEDRNGSTKNLELPEDVPDHLRPQRPRKTMFGSSDEAENNTTTTVVMPEASEASLNGTTQPDVSNIGMCIIEFVWL